METDEPLETGYGAVAPPGDNLCNDYAQGLADAFLALATARGDRTLVDDDVVATDAGSASLFANVVIARRPVDESAWPELAERLHDVYAGRQGGSFLLFSAWPTPNLGPLGFGRVGHPPLMIRPVGPLAAEPVDGLEIRPVTDATTAQDWEWALIHGYPEPALQPYQQGCFLPEAAVDAAGWRHWVGYVEGEPVATASAFVGQHHVDVEFISAMPSVRGRGVGRALTSVATLAEPSLPAMLISSDDGRPVYARMGYVPLLRFTLWAGHRRT